MKSVSNPSKEFLSSFPRGRYDCATGSLSIDLIIFVGLTGSLGEMPGMSGLDEVLGVILGAILESPIKPDAEGGYGGDMEKQELGVGRLVDPPADVL